MRCKNCGMANADTAKICSECGSPLPAPKPPAEPVKEPAQNAVQPPVQTPQAPVATPPAAAARPATPPIPPVTPQVNMNYPPTPPTYPYYAPPAQPMPYAPVQPPVNTAPSVQQPAPAQENVPQAPVGQNPFALPHRRHRKPYRRYTRRRCTRLTLMQFRLKTRTGQRQLGRWLWASSRWHCRLLPVRSAHLWHLFAALWR